MSAEEIDYELVITMSWMQLSLVELRKPDGSLTEIVWTLLLHWSTSRLDLLLCSFQTKNRSDRENRERTKGDQTRSSPKKNIPLFPTRLWTVSAIQNACDTNWSQYHPTKKLEKGEKWHQLTHPQNAMAGTYRARAQQALTIESC